MAAQYRFLQVVDRQLIFDPFFVFTDGNEKPSGIGYHFRGHSWDPSVYNAVMPINEAYQPVLSDHLRPFGSSTGSISRLQGKKNLYTNGNEISEISSDLSHLISKTAIPSGPENAQILLNGNFVDVTLALYHPTFTIYGPDSEILKTISFVNPNPSYITGPQFQQITPLSDGGFIAGKHQFSAAGEFIGEIDAPAIGGEYFGGDESVDLLTPDGKLIIANVLQADVSGNFGLELSALSPNLSLWGETTENETLQATLSGLNSNLANVVWMANGEVAQTGGTSFTLTDKHVGKTISATLSDENGNALLRPVTVGGNVLNINDLPTGGVVIEGELKQGKIINLNFESLEDEDGLGPLSFEWYSDGDLIENETTSSLLLAQELAGRLISAKVKYTDQRGNAETVEAVASSPVIDISYPSSGIVTFGSSVFNQFELVTADVSQISDDDGISKLSLAWLSDGKFIEGASGFSYRIKEADLGKKISVEVSVEDQEGDVSKILSNPQMVSPGVLPFDFELKFKNEIVVEAGESIQFVIEASHAAKLNEEAKLNINNGEVTSIQSSGDGLSHIVTVTPYKKTDAISLKVDPGAFADLTYGISTKSSFEGNGFCIADLELPENIYNVGDRYGYSDQLGDLHYDLFDKVEHNGDSYYYLGYSENSHLYRYFSDVKGSINTGAFKLTLPTKDELESLFTASSLDGTNSGNYISNNDVWWHQDYWYLESESGTYDSSMWLAKGYKDMYLDGRINPDKADAATVYKVEASQIVQLYQTGLDKFLEGSQNEFTLVRSGSTSNELKVEIEVDGIDSLSSNIAFNDSSIEISGKNFFVTLVPGQKVANISYKTQSLSNGSELEFKIVDSSQPDLSDNLIDNSHRLDYVAVSNSISAQSFNDIISGSPEFIGNFIDGSVLSVDKTSVASIADGEISYSYKWLKNGNFVSSDESYLLSKQDIGSDISLELEIQTEMGEVTKVLQATSLVAPNILDEFKLNQDENGLLNFGAVFEGGENLNFSIQGLPSSMNFDPLSGVISGSPVNEDVGAYELELIALSTDSKSISVPIKLVVNNVNDAPEFTFTAPTSTDEDAAFSYQLTASDIDVDVVEETLTYESVSAPSWMTVSSSGLISGTPANEDVGAHEVTVKVTDSAGVSDEKTFTLTVNNVNDAPEFTFTAPTSTDEDAAFSYQLTASDIDVDVVEETLTYESVSAPSWMTVSSSGLISGTPANEDVGSHEVTVKVTDNAGASDEKTFTLTINNVNDAPIFDTDAKLGAEYQDVIFRIPITNKVKDIDFNVGSEGLSFSKVSGPNWLLVSGEGELLGKATNENVGDHLVTLRVTDSAGASDEKTFTLTINNVNDAPEFTFTAPTSTDEDAAFSYQLTASDIDVDVVEETLTYESVSAPSWMNVSSSGLISGTPANQDVGDHEVTVKVTDSAGASDEKTFTLTINNVNDVPVLEAISDTSAEEDAAFSYQLTANDIDADVVEETLTYQAVSAPSWMTVSSSGLISGTPANQDVGSHEVTVKVTDNAGASDEKTFTLTVNNVNDVPVLEAISDTSAEEDAGFNYQLTANDIDADVVEEILTYEAVSAPSWMNVSSSGLISGTPANGDVGSHKVTVKVTDSAGASDEKTFTLTINNINDTPEFTFTAPTSTDEDAAFSYQLTANDIDADVVEETLTYEVVSAPSWMTMSSSGLMTGTPTNDDVGTYEVTVRVTDSAGLSDEKTFTLTVNNVNDAPIIEVSDIDGALADAIDESAFSHQLGVSDVDVGDSHIFRMTSDDIFLVIFGCSDWSFDRCA